MTHAYRSGDETSHFKMENVRPPDVYQVLIQHMRTAEWDPAPLMGWLYDWAGVFIVEFDLRLAVPPIKVDRLHSHVLGHYQNGRNCWGLEGEVAINEMHLLSRPEWQVLGTLLHELLHAWQYRFGKPGRPPYHNIEYRRKAESLGLLVDARGVTDYANFRQPDEGGIIGIDAESPFRRLLAKHGVDMPYSPPPAAKPRGKSTLHLWVCRCRPPQNARIGRGEFFAICPLCHEEFRRAEC